MEMERGIRLWIEEASSLRSEMDRENYSLDGDLKKGGGSRRCLDFLVLFPALLFSAFEQVEACS
jgi:hypothetical protein